MQFKKTVIAVKELHRFYRHSLLHLEKWNFHWPSAPSREHPAILALARKPSSKSTWHEQGTSQSLMCSQNQMSGGECGWRSPKSNHLKQGNHCKSRKYHPDVNVCKSKAHSIPTPCSRASSTMSWKDMEKTNQNRRKKIKWEGLSRKENSKNYLTHNFILLCFGATCWELGSNNPMEPGPRSAVLFLFR